MWAFGNVFYKDEDPDEFLEWLEKETHADARTFTDEELSQLVSKWRLLAK